MAYDVKNILRVTLLFSLWAMAAACGQAKEDEKPTTRAQASGEVISLTGIEELTLADLAPGERLRVLATTSIVGDVLEQVGGSVLDLRVLLPTGADPHGYSPTPGDLRQAAEAHLIFVNGFGLEANLLEALAQAAPGAPQVSLSEGIRGLSFEITEAAEAGDHGSTGGVDPHVWFDPANVRIWAQNAAEALSARDPAHAAVYRAHAQAYLADLDELDAWIKSRVQAIPEQRRVLVTDHSVFQYFAARYGFEVVGAVIPAYSSTASVSARELADLMHVIQETRAPAVFVGLTVNPRLAERIAADTNVALVPLYTGSLSEAGGPADSYLAMMRTNVTAVVEALK